MRFIEWLRIDELTKVSQIDSSGVELEKSGNTYISYFDDPSGAAGKFEVVMSKVVTPYLGATIWEVSFKKNNSYQLTGSSGSGGTAVYGKVLAAIKKLMEVEEVGGLSFSGFHPYMDVMYDRLTKAFGFVPVNSMTYLKKEIVDKEKSSNVAFSASADYALARHDKRIALIKKSKNVFKQALKNKASILGKVVGFDQYMDSNVIPAIVMDINDDGFSILKYIYESSGSAESWFDSDDVSIKNLGRLTSAKKIPAEDMSDMMAKIKNKESRIFKELQRFGLVNFDGSTYELDFESGAT